MQPMKRRSLPQNCGKDTVPTGEENCTAETGENRKTIKMVFYGALAIRLGHTNTDMCKIYG